MGDLKDAYVLRNESGKINAANPVDVEAAAIGSPADAQWGGSGDGTLVALLKYIAAELASTLSVVLSAGTNLIGKVAPSADQDPIYDHANGVAAAVTASSSTAFTPPAGCKYALFYATADTWVRTDNQAAAIGAGPLLIQGGAAPSVHPVSATVAVRAITASTATLYVLPMKERS